MLHNKYMRQIWQKSAAKQWKIYAQMETPSIVNTESIWTFSYLNPDNELIRSLNVRLTNIPALACVSGEWFKMEILSEIPKREFIFDGTREVPSYSVEGRNLSFMLSGNVCDGGMDVNETVCSVSLRFTF